MRARFVRRFAPILAVAALAVAARTLSFVASGPAGVPDAGAQSPPPLDHFLRYEAKEPIGLPHFVRISHLAAVDGFGDWHWEIVKPLDVCDPASVDGNDPSAPSHAEHLESYQIKRVAGTAKFSKLVRQTVVDEFGQLTIDVVKPERMMVPSATDPSAPPTAPGSPAMDVFTCYKIKTSGGTAKFTPVIGAVVETALGTVTMDMVKPAKVCIPTSVQGGPTGAETHRDHLTCYKAKPRSTFATGRVYTANALSSTDVLDLRKPFEVCVPSELNPSSATPTPTTTPAGTPTGPTPSATLSETPTPTFTGTTVPTATRTATPTPTRTPTPTPTATPILRTCSIGAGDSRIALQVKNAPIVGNIRVSGVVTGTQTFQLAGPDANGVRQIVIPSTGIHFDPIVVNVPFNPPVRLCVTPTGPDGVGKIDCNGGEPGVNVTVQQDHDTSTPPGANGGLPQDPECDDSETLPDGSTSSACLESGVTTCNPNSPHPGACNSPTRFIETGTFGSGAARIAEYLTLRQVSNVGPDGVQCTDDDTYSAPAALRVFLTTGTAHTTVFDANDIPDNLLDDHATGCTNCTTEVIGAPRSCNLINGNGGLVNLKMVAALPVIDLDATVGDAGVTVELRCE